MNRLDKIASSGSSTLYTVFGMRYFTEIIDPLDEEWQVIFKNAYLVLKEIVDLNIETIDKQK